MTTREAIQWFKQTFDDKLKLATINTPYTADMLCAIAYQETGSIWINMAGKLSLDDIALLAVGDTLDTPNRKAFPINKQALLEAPDGGEMFAIARDCLVKMAQFVKGYNGAVANPDKFCHGFGIFQYDLQHFKEDPPYFLEKKWGDIDACFSHCISELDDAKTRQGWKEKTSLTDEERVFVAIAYNKGKADLSKGFRQGFKSADGKFYGENIFEYLKLAQSIQVIEDGPVAALNVASLFPPTAAGRKKNRPVKVAGAPIRSLKPAKISKTASRQQPKKRGDRSHK